MRTAHPRPVRFPTASSLRSLIALGLVTSSLALGSSTVAGCSQPMLEEEEGSGSDAVSVGEERFDRNELMSDAALTDTKGMTAREVQAFFDKTPWNTKSGLAAYEENGRTAAQIFHAAAVRNGINPLALLVRAQMEQGLVSKTSVSADKVQKVFGCGCADNEACKPKYAGLEAQAECAAGTMKRSMAASRTSPGTAGGWVIGKAKKSLDGVSITPKNAATAALYTYTPWVGELGGGQKDVGGASLHHVVWKRFAEFVKYEAPESPSSSTTTEEPEMPELPEVPPLDPELTPDAGTGTGTGQTADAGAKTPTPPPAAPPVAPPADGSEDKELVGGETPPPVVEPPPPRSSTQSTTPAGDGDDEDGVTKKPREAAISGGCSATPKANAGTHSFSALALGALGIVVGRRRRRARA